MPSSRSFFSSSPAVLNLFNVSNNILPASVPQYPSLLPPTERGQQGGNDGVPVSFTRRPRGLVVVVVPARRLAKREELR